MPLSADERRALAMLANAGHNGMTQSLLTMHGFHPSMVAELIRCGLASMTQEKVRAAGGVVEVVTIRVTEAGRDALAAEGRGATEHRIRPSCVRRTRVSTATP